MNRYRQGVVSLSLIVLMVFQVQAQPQAVKNASEIRLAIQKLNVLGTVLYVAAHPDDENTAVLAYFAKEKLLRTGYLSLTRGSGGQNLVGNEKGRYLGVLRTQELLAARGIDGAEQFFTRAIDFGYSKSPEETMKIWGKTEVLSDIVWVIRKFRPDVILTRFTPEKGGHGHHRASAILALEAFRAAGDSTRFPEQLKYLKPWQPRRILWNAWRWGGYLDSVNVDKLAEIDVGKYNPLLGASYLEIAARSRSMHKSQGFGSAARHGTYREYFEMLAGEPTGTDLFSGINLGWSRVAGSKKVQQFLKEAAENFNPLNPPAILPVLLEAYAELQKLPDEYWVNVKSEELLNVIRSCGGLWMSATGTDFTVNPGTTLPVELSVINRSDYPFRIESVSLPFSEDNFTWRENLEYNVPAELETTVIVPQTAPYSQPYWLRQGPSQGLFRVNSQLKIGSAEAPPPLEITVRVAAGDLSLEFEVPVLYRWTDPVEGEKYRQVEIVPPVVAGFGEEVYVLPDGNSRSVRVRMRNFSTDVSGKISLLAPAGWTISPPARPFTFTDKGEETLFDFEVTPPPRASAATLAVRLEMPRDYPAHDLVTIDYPHIPVQVVLPETRAKLIRMDIQISGRKIGYIMGSGDDIPQSLKQLGYEIVQLGENSVKNRNLDQFDAIIVGIRAYNTRDWLRIQNEQLLAYVRRGGTLVVQYSTTRGLVTDSIGPYPFRITHDRVTDETATVNFLRPGHPLLNFPNKITPADFEGWVQERGLYFAQDWDARYLPLFSSKDPGEPVTEGSLLYTEYGKGVFIYTGLSFFRQLPAGVPGAFRLFVNLISAGNQNEK